jgi:hypothetical protein
MFESELNSGSGGVRRSEIQLDLHLASTFPLVRTAGGVLFPELYTCHPLTG